MIKKVQKWRQILLFQTVSDSQTLVSSLFEGEVSKLHCCFMSPQYSTLNLVKVEIKRNVAALRRGGKRVNMGSKLKQKLQLKRVHKVN